MDRVFGFFILGIVCMVAAVLVVPGFVNWNDYRGQIETYAGRITGRTVTIQGDISLALLPKPALSIQGLSIAGNAVADGPAAETVTATPWLALDRLEVNAALTPVLMGDIQVDHVTLVNPKLFLERGDAGAVNWQLDPGADFSVNEETGTSGILTALINAIRLNKVRIENGEIRYQNRPAKIDVDVTGLTGTFSADTVHGPMSWKGRAVYHGMPVKFEGALGDFSGIRSTVFETDLELGASATQVEWRGVLEQAQLSGPLTGTLTINGEQGRASLRDLAVLFSPAALSQTAFDGKAVPIRLQTNVVRNAETFATEDLTLDIGTAHLTGEIAADPDNAGLYAAKFSAVSFNMDDIFGKDALWPALSSALSPALSSAFAQRTSAPPAPAEAEQTVAKPGTAQNQQAHIIPHFVRGTFQIDLENATQNGAIIRNIHVSGLTHGGEIILDSVFAKLPGSGTLSATARLAPEKGGIGVAGDITFATDNPFRTLDWMGLSTDPVAGGTNPVRLTGTYSATPGELTLTDFSATLNGQTVRGAVARKSSDKVHTDIQLTATEFDGAKWAQLFHMDEPSLEQLINQESHLNLDLAFDSLQVRSLDLLDVRVDGSREDSVIALETLRFRDSSGARTDLSGTFQGPLSDPKADLHGTVQAKNLDAFLKLLGLDNPAWVLSGPADLQVRATTDDTKGLTASVTGTVAAAGQPPLTLKSSATGKSGTYAVSLSAANSTASVKVSGQMTTGDTGLSYDVLANADAVSWPAFGAALGHPLTTSASENQAFSASGKLIGADKTIQIQALSARAGSSELSGDVTLIRLEHAAGSNGESSDEATLQPEYKIEADIQVTNLDTDEMWPHLTGKSYGSNVAEEIGQLDRALNAPAETGTVWTWLAGQEGTVKLSAKSSRFAAIPIDALTMDVKIGRRQMNISELSGEIFDGAFNGAARYAFDELVPELTGIVDLANIDVAQLVATVAGGTAAESGISGRGDIKADISMLGTTAQALKSSLSGSGTLNIKAGTLAGLDVTAFDTGIDGVASLTEFSAHAQKTLSAGITHFNNLNGDVALEVGVLTIPRGAPSGDANAASVKGKGARAELVTASADGTGKQSALGRIELTGTVDLNAKIVNGEGHITLASRSGTQPAVKRIFGPITDVSTQINANAMGVGLAEEFAKRAPADAFSEEDKQIDMYRKGLESLGDDAP